ncbi:MAG: TRAP transporter small permease [Lachnospiraceae bacterium]|nr:TRAP transporter small permease [Lachnospiraceae bacterium]
MKVIRWLDRNFEKVILVVLLAGILSVNTVQIILRTFFGSSLSWGEELSRYMLIWSGFVGVSYTIRYNTAMRLTLIYNMVPRLARNGISLAVHAIMTAFFVWMSVHSVEVLQITQQTSATMKFSMKYVYACTVFCGVMSTIRCIQGIVRIVRNFKDGDDFLWDPGASAPGEASKEGTT